MYHSIKFMKNIIDQNSYDIISNLFKVEDLKVSKKKQS